MQIKTISEDSSLNHVALVGRLDVNGVKDVQYQFLQETTLLPKSTLVDLSQVSYIASMGISMLVSAAKHLEKRGARMVLRADDEGVELEVEDDGRAFDPTAAAEPELDLPLEEREVGGLGIHLLRAFARELRYERRGDRNALWVRIGS